MEKVKVEGPVPQEVYPQGPEGLVRALAWAQNAGMVEWVASYLKNPFNGRAFVGEVNRLRGIW